MAGRIRADDITLVKERTAIDDVVREHVTLRPAGPGSFKGLCPFHDEKTPSFTVRPAVGAYHCFGCGEGGDVLEFVMKVDHLSFTEAVERLAAKAGIELRYEDGQRPREELIGRRSRLVEAHRVAAEFYAAQLRAPGEARTARDFLRSRGFDGAAADHFGVGFAPRGMDTLARHLRDKGFSEEEIVLGGLAGRGQRGGLYDRFRGRLIWPIRDITGDPIGFGARILFDDDRIQAKYLNTSETPIYKKTQVLYGLDLAKKSIAGDRRAVIVEGYTDVMAAHLAGVTHAVATCGTAFGAEHIKTLRRILRDEAGQAPARVIFTFDGDAAGQKAAMKAFGDDQRWASQSFVAVAPGGQDPCDLRHSSGDAAVRDLVDSAVPMFEFAVRTTISRFDLDHAEGRVQAMRAAAPIIQSIRDRSLRPEYTRTVAGWLGVDVGQLSTEVARAGRVPQPPEASRPTPPQDEGDGLARSAPAYPPLDLRDPVVNAEHQLLMVLVQHPAQIGEEQWGLLDPQAFSAPAHAAVMAALVDVGRPGERSLATWLGEVVEATPEPLERLVRELSLATIPAERDDAGRPAQRYVESLVLRVQEAGLTRRINDAMSALQRAGDDLERVRALSVELQRLQREIHGVRAARG